MRNHSRFEPRVATIGRPEGDSKKNQCNRAHRLKK